MIWFLDIDRLLYLWYYNRVKGSAKDTMPESLHKRERPMVEWSYVNSRYYSLQTDTGNPFGVVTVSARQR